MLTTDKKQLGNEIFGFISEHYEIPRDNIHRTSTLREDLNLDSMDMAEMQMKLEEEYKMNPIPDDEARGFRTLGHVIDYVSRHQGEENQ